MLKFALNQIIPLEIKGMIVFEFQASFRPLARDVQPSQPRCWIIHAIDLYVAMLPPVAGLPGSAGNLSCTNTFAADLPGQCAGIRIVIKQPANGVGSEFRSGTGQ